VAAAAAAAAVAAAAAAYLSGAVTLFRPSSALLPRSKGPVTIAIRARYEHDTLQHATRFFVRSHTRSIPALHENQW